MVCKCYVPHGFNSQYQSLGKEYKCSVFLFTSIKNVIAS